MIKIKAKAKTNINITLVNETKFDIKENDVFNVVNEYEDDGTEYLVLHKEYTAPFVSYKDNFEITKYE